MTKTSLNKKNLFQSILFLILSVCLFILANPSFLYNQGIGVLAWIYYIPILFLINKCSYKTVWLAGGLFGFLFYAGYAYWLYNYGPVCFYFICILYFIVYSFLFLILKYVDNKNVTYNWLLSCVVLAAFEYIKTLGFLGFNYGVTVYTQYKYTHLIQITDTIGPFGLNFIMIFCSCFYYNLLHKINLKKQYESEQDTNLDINQFNTHLNFLKAHEKQMKKLSIIPNIVIGIFFHILIVFVLVYGFRNKDYGASDSIKICAIQHNEDPESSDINAHILNFKSLYELTDLALEVDDNIDVIVWPETAIVPCIEYRYFRINNGPIPDEKEEKSINLVSNVLNYINRKNQLFVIGNNGMDFETAGDCETQSDFGKIYAYSNDALVFKSKENVIPPVPEKYKKMKLVPFTEGFPYSNVFPKIYEKLIDMYGYLYSPGTEYKVFNYNNLYFSTPICFEDTFSDVARNMYKAGARCLINITNDSWSKSSSCQNQHLAMAVFRSIENRIPSVRSAATGVTCVISEKGEIIQKAEEFTKDFIICDVNLINKNRKPTFYCSYGLMIEYAILVFTGVFLLIQIITDIIINIKGKHNGKKR